MRRHPDYRFICQEIGGKFGRFIRALAERGKFIDWKSYNLGRLQSEMRIEYAKSTFE